MDKNLEPLLKEALKTTRRIYFPNASLSNGRHTGNLYLEVIDREFYDKPPWDSVVLLKLRFPPDNNGVQKEDTAYALTCTSDEMKLLATQISSYVKGATIVFYEDCLIDPEATNWNDFATYGTFRTPEKNAGSGAIDWVFINGDDRIIPF